ncbi:MAG: uridine kinase [Planctomycetes bacterium]|nr:uridine kinase [Planctomycetota bacterium]
MTATATLRRGGRAPVASKDRKTNNRRGAAAAVRSSSARRAKARTPADRDATRVIAERRTIDTPLSQATLSAQNALADTEYAQEVIKVLPDVNVVKIGGQSVMDRGRAALFPLIEEIAVGAKRHNILLCSGGGTRARHAYSVALDLELPTGVLAAVGVATAVQNARILQMLLAKHGGVYMNPEDFEKLPLYFKIGCIPIMNGMPPYEYWEKPAEAGRIPSNRTDSGTYLTGEFLGARSVIFVKDERGLYTDDPKKNPDAQFIPRISVQELLTRDLNDLVVERVVLQNMLNATHVRQIQVINGLEPGNLTRALDGEHVGTIIYVDGNTARMG